MTARRLLLALPLLMLLALGWQWLRLPSETPQQASPDDDEVSAIRARVYEARAASERSLMARGVFLAASRERSKR